MRLQILVVSYTSCSTADIIVLLGGGAARAFPVHSTVFNMKFHMVFHIEYNSNFAIKC